MCSRHAEYGAGYDITDATTDALQDYHRNYAHVVTAELYELYGTRTCTACGCHWKIDDLSAPNPIEDWCREPVKRRVGSRCLCHSADYVEGMLHERARLRDTYGGTSEAQRLHRIGWPE